MKDGKIESFDELMNIVTQQFGHRSDDPCVTFSYDNLSRLTMAQYDPNLGDVSDTNEIFTMDRLGNRTQVNVRDDSDVTYVVDSNTNRSKIRRANCGYLNPCIN